MDTARSVGVMASYLNPRDQSETLAVYRQQLEAPNTGRPGFAQTDQFLGDVNAFATRLVDAAPGQKLALAKRRSDANGAVFFDVAWVANGGTAGAFGSIYELRTVTVDADGVQWTTRGTAALTRWLTGQARPIEACVYSFRLQPRQ